MAFAAEKIREPNSPNGTSGDAVCLSTTTNVTPAPKATTHATTTTTAPASADAVSAAPSTSKRPVAVGSLLSGAAYLVSATTATHRGTLIAKIHLHEAVSTSHPPTTGPIAAATPESPAQVPIAGARSSWRNDAWMSAS